MAGKDRDLAALVVAVATPIAGGTLSSIATVRSTPTWYQDIRKPSWTPPQWAFGPVWTLLYLLMGVASWLVWRRRGEDKRVRGALALHGVQLVFNWLWTPIFFGWRAPGWALAEIVIMWSLVLATLIRFSRLRPAAGAMLVPYQLWVTVATALNASVWWLNRGRRP